MKRVLPRLAAERDADEAADYYTWEAGEDVARAFAEALQEAYRAIQESPGTGSPGYAHYLKLPGLRTRKLARFPFLIFYFEREDHVDVWRVLHAHRDLPAGLGEEGG